MGHSKHDPWLYEEDAALVDEQIAFEEGWRQAETQAETEADWAGALAAAPDASRQAAITRLLALYHARRCTSPAVCSCALAREELAGMPDAGLAMLRPYYERPHTYNPLR